MTDWIHPLSEPDLGEEEVAAVADCIRSAWLSTGPRTAELERRFAEAHGVRHAIAVANGTAALHLAFLALGIGRGERREVIQPSINFVASANMTVSVGATPVFADIVGLEEPTIDPAEVEGLIGPQTTAVVAMHYAGYPARMAELRTLCHEHELFLIEDACHAPLQPGANGRMMGTIGDVGCFSFFSNKNLTCGEGGMVVTNDDALARKIRALRSHGMTSLTWERHSQRLGTYDVTETGFNYRLDDLRAALALVQFDKLPRNNDRRRAFARAYVDAIAATGRDDLRYVFGHMPEGGTAHVGAVLVDPAIRDDVRAALAAKGIQTSLHYPPVHALSAFADRRASGLSRTEAYARSTISVPLYPTMQQGAPAEVVAALDEALATLAGKEKGRWLSAS